MSELIAVGSSEWSDGVTRINAMRKSWREDVEEDYNRRLALWNARYALLQDGRSQWIEEATVTAVGASAESMGLDLARSAESLIAGSEMLLIQEVIAEVPDLETVVSDTLNSPALTDMIAQAERLNTRARGPSVVAAYLPTMRTSGAAHELALRASSEIGEEVAARAALVTALQMADQVRMIEDGLVDGVADTNTQVESSVRTMMENSGYQLTGIRFRRRAIIDESLFGGVERETQYVSTYRHFIVPELELGVDLSRESLENRSARTIQASVTVAQKALEDYQTLIFGRDEDEDDDPFSHASAAFARQFEAAETAFMNSAGYNRVDDEDEYLHHDTDGLFNWHVGYAPTMQQKNPEKVDEAGYGEMGRIMEAFMINEARQQRGMANFDTPTYALKMWDDDKDNDGESDGFFGAPSIKDITNVAVSVAAYSLGAGPLVTAAINLMDDAVFTAADVATGFRKADEAWGSFGKQAAVSMASASVSGAFNGFGGNAGSGGLNNLVDGATKNVSAFTATSIDIGLGAAQGFTTNAVSGAISSFDFSSGKFDSKSFQNAIVGESALAGYAAGAVQTGTRSALGSIAAVHDLDLFSEKHVGGVHSLVGLGANSLAAATEYAIGGQTTINLLQSRSFGIENSIGMLELNLGGRGPRMELGTGGYDLSTSMFSSALDGIQTLHERRRIDNYIAENTHNASAENSLRAFWSFGGDSERATYENILADIDLLHLTGAPGSATARAQTIKRDGGGRDIFLGGTIGGTIEEQLVGATVLSHESFRDGVEDGSLLETRQATLGHTEFALRAAETYGERFIFSDSQLTRDVAAFRLDQVGVTDFGRYTDTNYDSSADYWRALLAEEGVVWEDDFSKDVDLTALGLGVISAEDAADETVAGLLGTFVSAAASVNGVAVNAAQMADQIGGLGQLGVSESALQQAVLSNGQGYTGARNDYVAALDNLVAQEIMFVGLPQIPDQSIGYGPMRGDLWLTSAYGNRIVTPSMAAAGVSGEPYHFGAIEHLGLDFWSNDPDMVFVAPEAGRLELPDTWQGAFGFQTSWQSGDDRLLFSHNSPQAVDHITRSVLASDGFEVFGGMAVGAAGTTGIGTGAHLDLRFLNDVLSPGLPIDPHQFYESRGIELNYTATPYATSLSGYPTGLDYFDAGLIGNIMDFSQQVPSQEDFFNNYLDAHDIDPQELIQLLHLQTFIQPGGGL